MHAYSGHPKRGKEKDKTTHWWPEPMLGCLSKEPSPCPDLAGWPEGSHWPAFSLRAPSCLHAGRSQEREPPARPLTDDELGSSPPSSVISIGYEKLRKTWKGAGSHLVPTESELMKMGSGASVLLSKSLSSDSDVHVETRHHLESNPSCTCVCELRLHNSSYLPRLAEHS